MFFGLVFALSIGAVSSAEGQELKVSPPEPEVQPLGRWSFGAGLGFAGAGDVDSSALRGAIIYDGSVLPASSLTPYRTALVEVALTRVFRLALGLQGSYSRQLSRERDPQPEHIIGRGPEGDCCRSDGRPSGEFADRRMMSRLGFVQTIRPPGCERSC